MFLVFNFSCRLKTFSAESAILPKNAVPNNDGFPFVIKKSTFTLIPEKRNL